MGVAFAPAVLAMPETAERADSSTRHSDGVRPVQRRNARVNALRSL